MNRMRVSFLILLLFCAYFIPVGIVWADIPLDDDAKWNLFGRVRLRFEQDDDSNPLRGHRTRARIGTYAGLKYTPDEHWDFIVRGRVGDKRDSRVVDMTYYTREDFSYGQRGVFTDQYFVTYTAEDTEITMGRANMPFWMNTEKLWDEDITPLGASMSSGLKFGSQPVRLSLGSFHMPDGLEHFHAWMHAAQLLWAQEGNDWNWQWALSLYDRQGEEGARYLPLGQDARDQLFGVFSAKLSGQLLDRPAYFGLDLFENFEGYSADDPNTFTRTFRNETSGYALAFNLGENKKQGDWRFRYVFARVEGLAAMSSYATTSFGWLLKSNVIVHDFRAYYSMTNKWRITGRISPAKEIIGTRKSARYRIDFSRSF